MKVLNAATPARVCSAVLRACLNGWCSARRFQRHADCILGCPGNEDSIEHYAFCSRYHAFCKRHAGLDTPPASDRLACFLGLTPSPTRHSRRDGHALRAATVYALYRVHGAVTNGNLHRRDAVDALPAMLREAARGSANLSALLSRARRRER